MQFNPKLWRQHFTSLPSWPCPTCGEGSIVLESKTPKDLETGRSKKYHSHDAWDPDWVEGRFAVFGTCSNEKCLEGVVVSGHAGVDVDFDDNGEQFYRTYYSPISIQPFPIVINVPLDVPPEVIEELQRASSHIWGDLRACVNAQRAAVEALLTARKVPRYKTINGKKRRQSLFARLEAFEAKNQEASELLQGIRVLGNAGSHSGELNVTREEAFDAFEIIEHVLPLIFDTKAKSIAAKAKKLKAKKK